MSGVERQLWITGIGMVSSLGANARETMDAVCRGERGFSAVSLFDTGELRSRIAAEVTGFRAEEVAPEALRRVWSRTDGLALVAAKEALAQAGLTAAAGPVDLVVGTTTGASLETELALADLADGAPLSAFTPQIANPLALTLSNLRAVLGPFRRARLVSSACATGATAVALAGSWLRGRLSDCVLVGASDALCRLTYFGFHALGSLDPRPCRPFDATRAGLSLGEAAAFLVVETRAHAEARGAQPIAELAGWCAMSEAHHITQPQASGEVAARTMAEALRVAGISRCCVDYINAHATATPLHDPAEIRAMQKVFGDGFRRVRVSSTKGQVGHTLGAAGALEVAITALAVAQRRVPPTAGLVTPDVACEAAHVIGQAEPLPIRAALSNSFGFGGLDASVVLATPGFRDAAARMQEPVASDRPRAVYFHRGVVALADSSEAGARIHAVVPQCEPGHGRSPATLASDAPVHAPRGPLPNDLLKVLDVARGRRLQRAEVLGVVAVDALDMHGGDAAAYPCGLVVARISGNPDATSVFMRHIRDKGARFASPAQFPNLLHSSLAAHMAIYHDLQGIAFATSDMGTVSGAAVLSAWELVASGYPGSVITAAVDPWGMLAQARANDSDRGFERSEGVAACVLGSEPKGALARVTLWTEPEPVPSPRGGCDRVLYAGFGEVETLRDSPLTAWRQAGWRDEAVVCAERLVGNSDAAVVGAFVLAAEWLARGVCERAVVLMRSDDGFVAICLDQMGEEPWD